MPDFSEPIPTRRSRAAIWQIAERLAQKLEFDISDPLEPIVRELGGRIVMKDSERRAGGGRLPESIIVRAKDDFTVYISTITSLRRDRFTISHELGHLFLHYPLANDKYPGVPMRATRWVDESNESLKRAEWEANWFAAAFLMPEYEFRLSFGENSRDLGDVADEFKVSLSAAENRAKSLHLTE